MSDSLWQAAQTSQRLYREIRWRQTGLWSHVHRRRHSGESQRNLIARLGYLKDTYDDVVTEWCGIQANVGGNVVTMTSPSEKVKVTNETIRASLIYRFDPNVSPSTSAAINWRCSTDTLCQHTGWLLCRQRYYPEQLHGQPESGMTLTIDDTTPGLDVSRRED